MLSEYSTSGKWLELLKEIAPRVTRAAVIRDPTLTAAVAHDTARAWPRRFGSLTHRAAQTAFFWV
jgi:hypothetical protein